MRKVLVLSASGVPQNVCKWTRAVLLLCKGKAELVEHAGRILAPQFPMPLVIKLSSYATRPFKSLAPNRENVIFRDGNTCQYCGRRHKAKNLTLDHVFPRSRGGRDTWSNLVAACHSCNGLKGDRTPDEARMPLLSVPCRPPSWLAFEVRKHSRSREEYRTWMKYIRTEE
jgi:5-methylcytosine-specific restriction endonuclease McrA